MSLQLASRIARLAAARGFTVTTQALATAEYAVQLERDGAIFWTTNARRATARLCGL